MKYTGEFNLDLLHEELVSFTSVNADGENVANYRILITKDGIIIELDDKSRFAEVDAIISKHDPAKKSAAELNKEQKKAVKDGLKVKLLALGLTTEELKILGISEN